MDVSWDQKSNTGTISLRRSPPHHIVNTSSKKWTNLKLNAQELRPSKDSNLYKIKKKQVTIFYPNMIRNGLVFLNFLVPSFLDINQMPNDYCFFELILKLKVNH